MEKFDGLTSFNVLQEFIELFWFDDIFFFSDLNYFKIGRLFSNDLSSYDGNKGYGY